MSEREQYEADLLDWLREFLAAGQEFDEEKSE